LICSNATVTIRLRRDEGAGGNGADHLAYADAHPGLIDSIGLLQRDEAAKRISAPDPRSWSTAHQERPIDAARRFARECARSTDAGKVRDNGHGHCDAWRVEDEVPAVTMRMV
jgi:hypothetical protein